ncbi:GGDEF-domain containing protein [Rhizocola hellebori]|uniref:GGDEF-domain containing protein n=1 Tax=Rhizocola hellebori TaxID=1392758 RepID=A0A8J3VDM2_9ACTN|nr:EAL domain-containing protein [Rhizocola hellebori]GIH02592.1 GGDEF-domain containing protein [Rhizocola hellebori]
MTVTPARVLAVIGAAVTVGVVAQLLYAGHPTAATVWDDTGQLVAGLAAMVSCFWNGWRSRGPQRTWRLVLGIGFAGWSIGMAMWAWYQIIENIGLPSPSAADAGFLTLPVFALAALLVLAANRPWRPPHAVLILDALVVVGSLFILTWATSLGGVVQAGAPTPAAFAVAIAYPASDLVLVTIMVLLVVFGRSNPRQLPALLTLVLGLVALSVSDSFFAYLVSLGAEEMPPIFDIGFIAGPALVALAATDRGKRRPEDGNRGRDKAYELAYLLLPYVPLAATGVLISIQLATGETIDTTEKVVGLLVLCMVVARQLITLLENRMLLERVRYGQARLEHQAFHDPLTGLANRALFHDRLAEAVEAYRLEHRPIGLLFIDLDDFKLVNDSYGHETGDMVLCGVADRLRTCMSGVDVVARLGGDEFAVLLCGGTEPEAAGELIREVLLPPFRFGDRQVSVSASIGAAVTAEQEPDLTADALLRRVDAAMYDGKQNGKGVMMIYRSDLAAWAHPDLPTLLAAAVRGEPHAGAIEVYYQPIVRLSDGAIVAIESLARWTSPQLGRVPPLVFVAAAERAGLVAALDDLVLDIACRETATLADLQVHVNISAGRLGCPLLEATVRDTLTRHGLDGSRLVLEITETSRIPDLEAAADSTRRLRDVGVGLAIDDFGTGYNTLAHLHTLPVDTVKLDYSLITPTANSERAEAIGRSVVSISRALGISVIAEGVQTQAQVVKLQRWGCHLGQGYLYGRPAPLTELRLTLAESPQKSLR